MKKGINLYSFAFFALAALPALAAPPKKPAPLSTVDQAFEDAAGEFQVPVRLLKSIAYVVSGWDHAAPKALEDAFAPQGNYGIMGLKDDPIFGTSLQRGAALIGREPEEVKTDLVQNIRAGAAYLRSIAVEKGAYEAKTWKDDSPRFLDAVRLYSGIPSDTGAEQQKKFIEAVYDTMVRGGSKHGVTLTSSPWVKYRIPETFAGQPLPKIDGKDDKNPKKAGDYARLRQVFEDASAQTAIPVSILMAIAYVETRWDQFNGNYTSMKGEERHSKETYGIMGLKDDDGFGYNRLTQSAEISGYSVFGVKTDVVQNIFATARLLRAMALNRGFEPSWEKDPVKWTEVLRSYSGIAPNPEDQHAAEDQNIYIYQVLNAVKTGYKFADGTQVEGLPISLPHFCLCHMDKEGTKHDHQQKIREKAGPVTVYWAPSPNIRKGRGTVNGKPRKPSVIVIHDTEGSFAGAVSWLRSKKSKVSAHYVIRSSDGYIKKLVRDEDTAIHAKCFNRIGIGIEHEGFMKTDDYYTDAMYGSSSKLVRYLVHKFGIKPDRKHIIPHGFKDDPRFKKALKARMAEGSLNWRCNNHEDTGPHWDWKKYFCSMLFGLEDCKGTSDFIKGSEDYIPDAG